MSLRVRLYAGLLLVLTMLTLLFWLGPREESVTNAPAGDRRYSTKNIETH